MVIPREPFGKLRVNPSIIKEKWARPERGKAESRGLRRDYTPAPQITKAYLLGILHDASVRKTTYRIATKSFAFSQVLVRGIKNLGAKAWLYKEGKTRNLWIVEFSKRLLKGVYIKTVKEKTDYIRGYFDSEGGIAKSGNVRFYLYFAQKDKRDLKELKSYLTQLGISCGKLHNPSKRIDSNYWRFYISAKSYGDFAKRISSDHPGKLKYLRMKI